MANPTFIPRDDIGKLALLRCLNVALPGIASPTGHHRRATRPLGQGFLLTSPRLSGIDADIYKGQRRWIKLQSLSAIVLLQ